MDARLLIGTLLWTALAGQSYARLELATEARKALLGEFAGARASVGQPESREVPDKAVSDAARLRLRASAWFTTLDGNGTFGEPIPGTTTNIDLIDTLGLDEDKAVLSASAGLNLGKSGRWHIDGGFNGPFDYDGTSGPINISFNDLQFTGVVDSEAKLNIYEINLGYDLIKSYPFTLTVGPGTRIFDLEATVRGSATEPGSGITEVREETVDGIAPLPGLGLAARLDLTPHIYLKGTGRGIYAGNYGNFFDVSAEAGYDLGKNLGVFAGYRWMHAEADVNDVEFDVNVKGLYAGLEVRF